MNYLYRYNIAIFTLLTVGLLYKVWVISKKDYFPKLFDSRQLSPCCTIQEIAQVRLRNVCRKINGPYTQVNHLSKQYIFVKINKSKLNCCCSNFDYHKFFSHDCCSSFGYYSAVYH